MDDSRHALHVSRTTAKTTTTVSPAPHSLIRPNTAHSGQSSVLRGTTPVSTTVSITYAPFPISLTLSVKEPSMESMMVVIVIISETIRSP